MSAAITRHCRDSVSPETARRACRSGASGGNLADGSAAGASDAVTILQRSGATYRTGDYHEPGNLSATPICPNNRLYWMGGALIGVLS